jgi:hypothetical protein
MLFLAALPILAALGATAPDQQPSALRLLVAAVIGLLAPLFWPGVAATPRRTALRIAGWAAGVAGLAALLLAALGLPARPAGNALAICTMLMAIMVVTHALLAGFESALRARSLDARAARACAGGSCTLVLALLGSLPLWLGPAGELLSARHEWVIDAVVGASPLTHLAVAGDNDLLRNEWLYQHSNLALLQFSYPGRAGLAWTYAAACLLLALLVLRRAPPRKRSDLTDPQASRR